MVEGDAAGVKVAAGVAGNGLALGEAANDDREADERAEVVCDGGTPRVSEDVADVDSTADALVDADTAAVKDAETPCVFDDVGVCDVVSAALVDTEAAAVSDDDTP